MSHRSSLASLLTLVTLVALAALAAGNAGPAQGASFTVDATHDAIDATPGDGICADAGGACTLRAAVMETNALPGADEISLPAGTYVRSLGESMEDAAATGDLDIGDTVTIIGMGSSQTIIDAGGLDRVLELNSNADATIVGVSVRNGYTTYTPLDDWAGGGIDNGGGRLLMTDVLITGNRGYSGGGGLFNLGGTVELTNVTISENEAVSTVPVGTGGDGGGIFNAGELFITDSVISKNVAEADGGGIYNVTTLTVSRSTIDGNTAYSGGGIQNGGTLNSGTANLTSTTISQNSARFVGPCEDTSVCAPGTGGGIMNTGTTSVTNVTISGNDADNAGGVANYGLVDSVNVTITQNTSGFFSGIYLGGPATSNLLNTIVAKNLTGWDCSGPVTSLGHNLDSDGTCGLTALGDISNIDPKLGPLADNGGPTQTHALERVVIHKGGFDDVILAGSPAIDTGDNAACPATDQRGESRPFDGTGDGVAVCDIGAFEQHQPAETAVCPAAGCPPGPIPVTPSPSPPIALPRTGGEGGPTGLVPIVAAAASPALTAVIFLARRLFTHR